MSLGQCMLQYAVCKYSKSLNPWKDICIIRYIVMPMLLIWYDYKKCLYQG